MIAKAVKGSGFRGALDYDLGKEQGELLDTNMAGSTPRELAAEFGEIRSLRPNLNKAVLHVSLSAAQGEKLTNDQWRDISQAYLHGMGLDRNQYVVTRHNDTDHEHIHIIANRIRFDGSVTSDSQDYKRQEAIMRQIERDYGLRHVISSRDSERKAPTKGELENMLRSNEPSAKLKLQALCDAAARDCHGYRTYQDRLEAVGVELVPVVQLQGAKMSGLSYRLDGVMMKGSDLGKAYSPAGLTKRGITYEQSRDGEAVSRSIEREKARAFGAPDRSDTPSQTPERGGASSDLGATRPSNGGVSGRDAADASRDNTRKPEASGELQQATDRSDPENSRGDHGSRTGSIQTDQRIDKNGANTLRGSGSDRDVYSGASERILALASSTQSEQYPRPASSSRGTETRPDRSLEAIERQVKALGVNQFEVGIRDAQSGQMMNRTWSRDELIQSTAWLKRMNAKGNDIYIRPAGEHGLVLVDDLKGEGLERIKRDLKPAALIETSPNNYQAWIKLSDSPIPAGVRAIVAKDLAQRYGGDLNSADSRHYGRLAGFTNQKPKHVRDGRQPYVLMRDWSGSLSESLKTGLDAAQNHFDNENAAGAVKMRLNAIVGENSANSYYNPVAEYRRQAKRLIDRYGVTTIDYSKMDYMIAKDMAKSGRFDGAGIEKAIREASPNIDTRKAGHIEDYAKRTSAKAVSAVAAERAQEREQEQDRGFSR